MRVKDQTFYSINVFGVIQSLAFDPKSNNQIRAEMVKDINITIFIYGINLAFR